MHPFPLDTMIFMVEPGVSELGLEGAMLRLAAEVGVLDQWGHPGQLKSEPCWVYQAPWPLPGRF